MKNFLARALVALFCFLPLAAHAQSTGTVVADCTTGVGLAYTPGSTRPMSLLPTGAACVSASVSASISGFTAASTGTPISVTTGGVTGTLPAGTVVVATNVGSTNAAYCALGASATTSSQYIAPSGGWFAFTVGASTQLTCITSTSTTTVNMTGGAGLPTGTGGGGGGGSGGTVTQGNAGSNAQAWWAQIGDTARGPAKVQAGNAAAVADVALTVTDPNLLAAVNSAIPAGTAIIGKVGIDQTTPGTTNAVSTTNWPTTVDTNSGNKSASTPRVVIATDQPNLTTALNVAPTAGTNRIGYVSDDPCNSKTKTNKPFTTNGTSSVELVAVSGSTVVYVCSLSFIAAGATTVAFTTGTGTACATNNAAVIGSTTANIANSMSFAANGGMTYGGGNGTVAQGAASSALCMINGTNVYVSGNLSYVQQ